MRRLVLLVLVAALAVAGAACSDDDSGASPDSGGDGSEPGPRFCDAYLDYLSDSSDENLEVVDEAAEDEEVSSYVEIMQSEESDITAVVAATLDLDDVARRRCQAEWTAGAQGAGNTAAAAQAFFDALVAGDRAGARNVASANAIAVFEPWEPLGENPDAGTPAIGDVDDEGFSIALGPATLAECQVETGVVVACQITE